MNIKVSIIIPVYNVEKYLERCLNSLIGQTLSEIEIILVNDGSTDRSADICNRYGKKDKRIQVIHKSNEGQGIARNVGLQVARGEYVCFIDSDDYIELNACELLYRKMKEYNADLCCFGYQIDSWDAKVVRKPFIKDSAYEGDAIRTKFILHYFGDSPEDDNLRGVSACMSIFRNAIIKEHNVMFVSERICLSEDTVFSLEFCKYAKKVIVWSEVFYHYCQNSNSFSQGYRKDKFSLTQSLYEILKKYADEYLITQQTEIRIAMMVWVNLMACLKQEMRRIGIAERKEVLYNIKEMCCNEMVDNEIPKLKGEKLPIQQQVLLFCVLKRFYYLVMIVSYIRSKIKL